MTPCLNQYTVSRSINVLYWISMTTDKIKLTRKKEVFSTMQLSIVDVT